MLILCHRHQHLLISFFFEYEHSCNLKIAQIKKNEKNMSKNYKLSRLFRNFVGRKKTYDISTKVL